MKNDVTHSYLLCLAHGATHGLHSVSWHAYCIWAEDVTLSHASSAAEGVHAPSALKLLK